MPGALAGGAAQPPLAGVRPPADAVGPDPEVALPPPLATDPAAPAATPTGWPAAASLVCAAPGLDPAAVCARRAATAPEATWLGDPVPTNASSHANSATTTTAAIPALTRSLVGPRRAHKRNSWNGVMAHPDDAWS